MTLYDRICALCEEQGLSIAALESKLSFGNGSIGKMKTKNATPRADRLQKIASYFGVTTEYLMTGSDSGVETVPNTYCIDKQKLPVLGSIACGLPKLATEERESYILAGTEIKADFCLIASGDSMINARIHDGDIVFIRQQSIVENGDIAAVIVNQDAEATLKRVYYYREKALLILKPENPLYDDLVFQNEEIDDVRILGKAIAFQSDVI